MPPRTATRAATRSATSPRSVPLHAADAARARARSRRRHRRAAPPATRRAAAIGRMAEASAGQGLGHRPLGDDGHRARSRRSRRFPTGFPPDIIAEFERRIGRGVARQHGGVGHGDHRRARRRAHAHRRARSSTPRPTACFRSPRTKTSSRSPELYRVVRDRVRAGRRRARRRPRHRAAVRRRARALHAHRQPPRLRAAADRRDAARSR